MSVVELKSLGKTFPGVRALHDVSLAIAPGEVLGLIGENGAGKSTLIKILGGVYAAGSYSGDVVIGGAVQRFAGVADARRAGIAVVHQELSLVPGMSVADNLVLGREPSRFGVVDAPRAFALASELIARVTDEELDLEQPVERLGIGVQQLLEIARALADRAKLIILDEPTAALTDSEIARLFAIIRERKATTSFIYISHRLDEIAALCDRVAVLRDGELVSCVPGTASTNEVVALMTGKELGNVHARRAATGELGAPVLEVDNLVVNHPALRGRRVVDGLSFAVRAGEVVALAGAMGAGRTATLSALFGCAKAGATGRIAVDGTPRDIGSPKAAIAAGLALVPEDRKGAGLVLGASVADNLALASHTGAFADAAALEQSAATRARELAIKAPHLGAEVATLSGGNQQKIVIGKWLARAPRVLLLDEPTRGVDVGAKAEIYALIDRLIADGHAVVLASSDLPEVVRLAHRVLVLREGKLAGELAGDAITQLAIMQLAVGDAAAQESKCA